MLQKEVLHVHKKFTFSIITKTYEVDYFQRILIRKENKELVRAFPSLHVKISEEDLLKYLLIPILVGSAH